MLPVPLLSQAEGIKPLGAIHSEHAIEVINLVLEQFGPIAFDLDLLPIALQVLVSHPDAIGARDSNQKVGEGETVVPYLEILSPDIDNFRVDERPGPVHLDIHHAYRGPDLGGCYSTATAESGLPIPEGFPHVIHDDPNPSGPRFGNWLAARAQNGIAQQPDAVYGHLSPPL
jgi:hypothetical protein